jgi:hypothetical protein
MEGHGRLPQPPAQRHCRQTAIRKTVP